MQSQTPNTYLEAESLTEGLDLSNPPNVEPSLEYDWLFSPVEYDCLLYPNVKK